MQGFMKFVFTQGEKGEISRYQESKKKKKIPPTKPKMSKIPSEQG